MFSNNKKKGMSNRGQQVLISKLKDVHDEITYNYSDIHLAKHHIIKFDIHPYCTIQHITILSSPSNQCFTDQS